MEFFAWLENTSISIWTRESPLVFPSILVAHALGMGCLVGVNVVLALRASRFIRVPMSELERFVPLMWIGFVASLCSGVLLLLGYPAKALTNPVFYVKFAFIAAGFVLALRIRRARLSGPDDGAALLGALSLLAWFGAITAGRLLAYTHDVLLASHLV